jgi:glycosyltransferase involved in cell wall biosynthesis
MEVKTELMPDADKWRNATEWPGLGRKLRVLVAPANKGGCSFYRAWNPFQKIEQMYGDCIEFRFNENPLCIDMEKGSEAEEKEDLDWCDVFFTQNLANYGGPATLRYIGLAREKGKFVWYDTDDLLTDIYDDHRLKGVYMDNNLQELTKYIYANAHLVSVTQNKFAERISPFCNNNLVVLKNQIDYSLPAWNAPKQYIESKKHRLRVGWVAGIHHEADIKEFARVPAFVNNKVGMQRVHWQLFGRPPYDPNNPEMVKDKWQQDVWDNYIRTFKTGMRGNQNNVSVWGALPTADYGSMYTAIDLSIAPLQENEFNDSKSDIKVAECGRYKVPLVASNVGCYSDTIINGQTGYLVSPSAPPSEWVRVLTKLIKDPLAVKEMGENLHKITEEMFSLEKNAHVRLDVLEYCMQEWVQNKAKEEAAVG